jgi:hypothetical protein
LLIIITITLYIVNQKTYQKNIITPINDNNKKIETKLPEDKNLGTNSKLSLDSTVVNKNHKKNMLLKYNNSKIIKTSGKSIYQHKISTSPEREKHTDSIFNLKINNKEESKDSIHVIW